MTMQDDVVEDDFLLKEDIVKFAIKHYYTPLGIDSEEFYGDLKRFKYIKRLVLSLIHISEPTRPY